MGEAVYIVAAARTPIGRFNGALADVASTDLGAATVRAVIDRAAVEPDTVDEVIMGQVLMAGAGMNPARQAAIHGGVPNAVPSFTVNKVCGSGLKAIQLAAQSIAGGDAKLVIAGGQESMSRAPHLLGGRRPTKLGEIVAVDSIMVDGLVDAFHGVAMGITAERLATSFNISRDAQDAFALRSHEKAVAAMTAGRFADEIVPLLPTTGGAVEIAQDEQPRADSSLAKLGKLAPAFGSDGTVTAGNAASLNDGAAAIVLMGEAELRRRQATPLARIVATASAGLAPMEMGLGAGLAGAAALARAGWTANQLDLIELNEAFAVQAMAVIEAQHWDPDKVNVNGGAVALGHPIGASGARIVVTLLHELQRRGGRRGLATLCIGGGQGIALCVERP